MIMRVMASAVLLVLSGCGLPANVVILLPDENGTVGKLVVHEGGSTAELDKPLTAVDAGSEASLRTVFTTQRPDVESEFAGALDAAPRAPLVYILQFQPGLAELDSRSRGDLAAATAGAKGTSYADISVIGHADATGTDPYNLALSLKRAETVRDSLVAAGVPSDIIEITYHGANNPLIPTPRGVPEARNRRVEVTIR
jgi:outer membrane protein OmpA-like peptidoglycan-associated protein